MVSTKAKQLADNITESIERNGINYRDLSDLLCVAVEAMKEDTKWALKVTKYIKECCRIGISRKIEILQLDVLEWEVLRNEGRYWFDSYLIYLERKRDRRDMFYLPKRKQLLKHGLIQALQQLEDDEIDILGISMPPGTQKTTLEKFFISWVIGRHLDDYNLFFSHSGDITRMFYDGVLDITTNTEEYCWNEIFPEARLSATDAKREQITFNKYKPFANLQCTSVGSKNAGKVRCNRYLCCDDLIGGIEEALNMNYLNKLWRIYGTDARQRKLNEHVKELHVATRWSVHDVIGRLQALYAGNDRVKFIVVPDIDPDTGKSNFDYEFNGMSEQFFKDQELAMDAISYKCLYKNQPVEREGLLYHEEELLRYRELPEGEPDAILGIADTKNKGTDFFFQPCFYQYGDKYYLVDCICDDTSDYGLQYRKSAGLIIDYNMQQVQFETNNGGDRVADNVQALVEEMGGRCNITSRYTSQNKETKILVNSDWIKKHIYFKSKDMYTSKSDYGVMMSWLVRYSTVGKNPHDDVPDGLSCFCEYVTTRRKPKTKFYNSPF